MKNNKYDFSFIHKRLYTNNVFWIKLTFLRSDLKIG